MNEDQLIPYLEAIRDELHCLADAYGGNKNTTSENTLYPLDDSSPSPLHHSERQKEPSTVTHLSAIDNSYSDISTVQRRRNRRVLESPELPATPSPRDKFAEADSDDEETRGNFDDDDDGWIDKSGSISGGDASDAGEDAAAGDEEDWYTLAVSDTEDMWSRPGSRAATPVRDRSREASPAPRVLEGREFARARERLTREAYDEFNARVFGSRLPAGLELKWDPRLRTTAGMAVFRVRSQEAFLRLSTKVLTDSAKLRSTLAHEMCHLACFLLDGDLKAGHGPRFKRWGRAVEAAYPALQVRRCHNYEIHHRHRWRCTGAACAVQLGRHSNKLDVARVRCAQCGNAFEYMGAFNPDGTPAKARAPSAFSKYVQTHSARVRERHRGVTQPEVMRLLAQEWREQKQTDAQPAGEPDAQLEAPVATAGVASEADDEDPDDDGGSFLGGLVKKLIF